MSMMNGMHNIRSMRVLLYASGLIQAIFTSVRVCVCFF